MWLYYVTDTASTNSDDRKVRLKNVVVFYKKFY